MPDAQRQAIKLTNLIVSIENPRFEMVTNQRDAIQLMVDDQPEKLIKLAKDILDAGLNPGDPIYVTPNKEDKKRFTVLEGNRRVSILKILNSPDIVDAKSVSFLKKLKPHVENFAKKPISNIDCLVFENPADADKWIELKHTGENGGVGTVAWDTTQQARFSKKIKGHNPIALQAIEFLQRSNFTDHKLKEDLSNLTYTNVERLLTDPDVRDVLGIKYTNKILSSDLQEPELVKGLSKIASDFLYKDYTVNAIRTKNDRKNYIEGFQKTELPDKTNKSKSPWQLISSTLKIDDKTAPINTPKSIRSLPPTSDRKYLIPKNCIIKITDQRVNTIYHELKDLNVADFVNSTAVIFRVFIELSIDAFIASKQGAIKGVKKLTPLKEKIEKVADYLEARNLLTDHELKGIRVSINDAHDILAIDTFNAYVHNRHYSPNEQHLKRSWDVIQVFIEKIWELV
ncbi:hypothetical protein LJ707_05380 [Mucilaginibacter sp. UR6-1]|uniref:hypothetical protein n=1 Tax=Mucilaginibacter sp. UR6-1 TaxID=1435643 RepID=UPI001E2CCD2C|nr:hypothetical protein [Mucilaginibacter sp. UR6-1]MCC8408351.1 hypothetical protein [Mucilaginibacter sp. UR6-1]